MDSKSLINKSEAHIVDSCKLHSQYPTHRHSPEFWEALGRCVGTFGFLEHTLKNAIILLKLNGSDRENESESALMKLNEDIEKALSDPLAQLIAEFANALEGNDLPSTYGVEGLIPDLEKVREWRNVICHGSWQPPGADGKSKVFFIRKGPKEPGNPESAREPEIFDTRVDIETLNQLQSHCANLAVSVQNSVTAKGLQFPGTTGLIKKSKQFD